jgi:hypothetical protein
MRLLPFAAAARRHLTLKRQVLHLASPDRTLFRIIAAWWSKMRPRYVPPGWPREVNPPGTQDW